MSIKYEREFGKLIRTETASNIPIKEFYNPDDVAGFNYKEMLGDPGCHPYTRGIFPKMYRSHMWLKSQICCYAHPKETNEAFKKFIASGQTGLRILVDTTTAACVDPDHPLGLYTRTCNGTPTFAVTEYEEMLAGIPLENVDLESACAYPGGSYFTYVYLLALMEKRGENIQNLRGTGINDPIHSAIVFDTKEFQENQWELAKKTNLDLIEFSAKNTPKWHPCTPCGYDMRDAGINSIQELAFCLGNAIQYYGDAVAERGVKIDDFRPMAFSQSIEMDFFEAIAKFRALRRMWSKIAKEYLGAKKERSMACRIGARTAGNAMSIQEKAINHTTRLAIQSMAAIMGGAQSLDLAGIDEAFGLPSEEARIFGLDAGHIIAHEANIPLTADPLGGSYYVEWLTNKIEEETWKLLNIILEKGGMWKCLKSGWLKKQFLDWNWVMNEEITNQKRIIVGWNAFKGQDGPISAAIKDSAYKVPCAEERQVAARKLVKLRETRNQRELVEKLTNLWQEEKDGKNSVRASVDAAKAYATIGEIIGTLRMAHGHNYDPYNAIPTPSYLSHLKIKN
jgi:methylmalonyl-CoA mutase N-terminal domain/subunit